MSTTLEDVAILVDADRFRAWEDVSIVRALDAYSTVTFSGPFEPERQEFRQRFEPFSFKPVEAYVSGALLFTGTLIDVAPDITPDRRAISVTCHARPDVLSNCTMPPSAFPLEVNGLTLRQIAERICEPFDLAVQFDGPRGAAFRRVALKPDEMPQRFLADLAKQRNMVVSNTADGALHLLQSAAPGRPVARLREGHAPLSSVRPRFEPQSYFSEVTGLRKSQAGRLGAKHTVRNPWLPSVARPHTFAVDDADRGDIPEATRAKLGRMFGNMVSYSVEVPTWRDPNGDLWKPNTTVTLEAPGAMVYRETELLIRTVTLQQTPDSATATLDLVLPGAFSGEAPEVLPWQ